MFPDDIDLNTIETNTVDDTNQTTQAEMIGRSIKFNYQKKCFEVVDGKLIEPSKIDAIKQWIELFIRTEVGKYGVYNDEFGVNLKDLVSYRLPRGYQISEIMRRINVGILEQCPNVVRVSDWNFDKGTFSFTVKTNTGEEVVIYE